MSLRVEIAENSRRVVLSALKIDFYHIFLLGKKESNLREAAIEREGKTGRKIGEAAGTRLTFLSGLQEATA